MKGTEFLEKLELVDPAYIEAADNLQTEDALQDNAAKKTVGRKKILPFFHLRQIAPITLAACVCLLLAFAVPRLLPKQEPDRPNNEQYTDSSLQHQPDNQYAENSVKQPPENDSSDQPGENHQNSQSQDTENIPDEGCPSPAWDFHYNEVAMVADSARQYIPGYFTQELHESDRMLLEPGKQIEWMSFSAVGGFDGEGRLLEVSLSTTSTLPDTTIQILISDQAFSPLSCGLLSKEDVVSSSCNGVDFLLYQHRTQQEPAAVFLYAEAEINELFYSFEMETASENIEQAQADFEEALECFTFYQAGKEEFASIAPDEIPEWFNRTLTYKEALEEADFGTCFLPSLPDGYQEESIQRYKDQHYNTLSGLWTKGYDSLSWLVRSYRPEDAARQTAVADTKNYDLSLYPIPRADSVPDDLREIVDNPIFDAKELTLETVYARAYQIDDAGDSAGWRMAFSVRYEDTIVEIHAKGVTPEWIYEQLEELRDTLS